GEAIGRDAFPQRCHLTRDGVRLGVLLRRHAGVEYDLYGVHACCLLPTCRVGGARSAGWGAPARRAGRRVIGTTRSYACATQVGLPQLGSNVMRTARVMLPVCPRRATLVSLPPGCGAFTGRHALQRCPQKPLTIPGAQLGSWNTCRELYRQVSNFVGSVVSPIRAELFRHDVLDEWCGQVGQPRMQGRCVVTRCAEDCLLGFAFEADAHRVMDVLPKRFQRCGLTIHPEKTVLRAFQRPPNRAPSARGKGTCDFLGFPHSWATTRRGYWVIKRKTVGKRLRQCMKGIGTWCREHRPAPLNEQYRALCANLRGHYQYYGIRGNFKMLEAVFEYTERAWQYWLSRRSYKGHLNWQKFVDSVHRKLPLPKPRIMHHI